MPEDQARALLAAIDATIDDDAEPEADASAFNFILDLMDGHDLADTGKRFLPTQVAMALAPEQVTAWLDSRPDPDAEMHDAIPVLPVALLAGRAAIAQEDRP